MEDDRSSMGKLRKETGRAIGWMLHDQDEDSSV